MDATGCYKLTRSRNSHLPGRQFALKASEITMLVLCPSLLSDKTGFCLKSPDAPAPVSQVPGVQSLDNTAGAQYSYSGIKKSSEPTTPLSKLWQVPMPVMNNERTGVQRHIWTSFPRSCSAPPLSFSPRWLTLLPTPGLIRLLDSANGAFYSL